MGYIPKILIVDDSSLNIEQVESALDGIEEVELMSNTNGKEALEMVLAHHFAVAILDVQMPEMNGFELAERLRNIEQTRHLPIIFLSAVYSTVDYIFQGYESGAVDYLIKPFNPIILRNKIQVFVDLDRQKTELEISNKKLKNEIVEREQSEEKRAQLETQLRHSQKMKALGTLTGGIAHDFNNILFSILGFSEMLSDYRQETEAEGYLQNIVKSAKRAQNVVKQLLTFANSKSYSFVPVKLVNTIQQSLEMVRISLPANIEIHQNFSSQPSLVMAKEPEIYQTIVNICLNAKEAMEEFGGRLEVSLDTVELEGIKPIVPNLGLSPHLRLRIRDTGRGMSPETQERIFDPFFTTKGLGGTEKGVSKEGTGLGLYMVYNIMRNHQGAITVESEIGKGTTFDLYFPIFDGELPEANEKTADTAPSQKLGTSKKCHFLVAEDEPILLKMYGKMIERQGFTATLCQNGKEAFEIFCDNPDQFNLILTDQEMPKMTGIQLSQEILKIRPDIPIFLATGYSSLVAEENYKSFGIRAFFMKPVDMNGLLEKVQAMGRF